MICNYSDHAANERTFLAWVRTGIAVIAFGFVIERFKLVVASMTSAEAAHRLLENPSGPLGHYEGLTIMFGGLVIVLIATWRFVRTGHLLNDSKKHPAGSASTELALSAALVLVVLLSVYLVFWPA